MTKLQLTHTPTGSAGTPHPGQPQAPLGSGGIVTGGAMLDLSALYPEIGGSVNSVRQEVDDAFEDMKTFLNREPDEVMRLVSGHSSRLSELRVRIHRWEDRMPFWRPVRVREIEPCIEELRQQYVYASRLQSTRELDFKMSGGQP